MRETLEPGKDSLTSITQSTIRLMMSVGTAKNHVSTMQDSLRTAKSGNISRQLRSCGIAKERL